MAEFLSLSKAIRRHVRDGDSVAMEGFTHLIPFAAAHEVIRQGRKRLTLIRMTPDLIYDQMIGMGAAEKLVFSWGGNPGVGSLHRLRDAVENGWPQPLALEEHSHAAMANAYEAGAANLPFAMFRSYGDYTTNLPLKDLLNKQAWIAFKYDGADLAPEHGGPARLLVPHLYLWKSAKWVKGMSLMVYDKPGFWEGLGYHMYGDPWQEQRYSEQ